MQDDVSIRYVREGETYLIEIRLREIRQLFHSLDPAPFREKDLDADAETYIVESVQDLPTKSQIKLVIHLPEPTAEQRTDVPDAVRNYFSYRAGAIQRHLRETLRRGRIALAIGVAFLICCITLRGMLPDSPEGFAQGIFQEGLLISGWVAMWGPIQIFLYDWWPIWRSMKTQERIARIPVEVRPTPRPIP